MPLGDHPSFDRPAVDVPLWRYTDLPKFVEMLTSGSLWLTSAEVLARDDPYECLPGPVQFPHRMWKSIDEVPEALRVQILQIYGGKSNDSPEAMFRGWVMVEEQRCIMTRSGRRDYFISCWHAAKNESAAMWKVYGAPGAGVAVVTNGGRMEHALACNEQNFYLGAIQYRDPSWLQIGSSNGFDSIMIKRDSYAYEQEVRLVHWHTGESHDALANFDWNDETLRFDNLIEDNRPLREGMALSCDIDTLIERVVVSPFAPAWYIPMIERLRDRLGFSFPVHLSKLMEGPPVIP